MLWNFQTRAKHLSTEARRCNQNQRHVDFHGWFDLTINKHIIKHVERYDDGFLIYQNIEKKLYSRATEIPKVAPIFAIFTGMIIKSWEYFPNQSCAQSSTDLRWACTAPQLIPVGQCLGLCHFLTAGRYEQVRNHSTPLALFAIGTSKSSNIALLGHSFRTATHSLFASRSICLAHCTSRQTLEENSWFVHDCSLLITVHDCTCFALDKPCLGLEKDD